MSANRKAALPKRYYFVRHGKPESEASSFHQSIFRRDMLGKTDEPLSAEGREQAHRVGRALSGKGVELVVSSTLKRAMGTADIVAEECNAPRGACLPMLDELAPGETWSSRHILPVVVPTLRNTKVLRRRLSRPLLGALTLHHFAAWALGHTKGGESRAAVFERIAEALRWLDNRPERTIVCACHGYFSFLLAFAVTHGFERAHLARWVEYGAVTEVHAHGGEHRLEDFARRF